LLARANAIAPRIHAEAATSLTQALEIASRLGHPIVVAGSLYLAGEVRALVS
jgi:folylpolyglutamate synthase/dihydropteroate synthase